MTIGDRIKRLRIDNNETLESAGKKTGVSKQTLYKYENNIVTNIPSDKIELLAKLFNTTPAYLMGWEDNNKAIKREVPDELAELGVEWVKLAKKCKNTGLSLEQMEKLIDAIKNIK